MGPRPDLFPQVRRRLTRKGMRERPVMSPKRLGVPDTGSRAPALAFKSPGAGQSTGAFPRHMVGEDPTRMRKLLFVDDTPDVLNALRTTLSRMGNEWDMEFVASGQEALAHLKKIPVDAVISDMVMPGMDGVRLLSEVRKTYPQTVRIGCTGYAGQEGKFSRPLSSS